MRQIDATVINEYQYTGEGYYVLDHEQKKLLVKDLGTILASLKEIRFAYIHGSFVNEFFFRDIDIAVYYDDNVQADKQLDISLELSAQFSHKLHLPVDVHSLNRASPGFCYEVTKGTVLLSRDEGERFDFVERNWMEYFDFQYLMRQNLNDLITGE